MRRGPGNLVTLGIAGVCLLGAAAAFFYSQGIVRASDAEREVRGALVDLSKGMARCAANKSELPASTGRVPARLADVSGKKYTSLPDDWRDPAYRCANFSLTEPQVLQYAWEKTGDTSGRALAIGDTDGDGKPDRWFEVEISCPTRTTCEAANYVVEVLEDGTRVPPSVLRWLGRAKVKAGEPPALLDEPSGTPAGKGAGAGAASSRRADEPARLDGSPVVLSAILNAAEAQARAALPHSVLLEFAASKLLGPVADPKKRAEVRVTFGVPDPRGTVAAGSDVLLFAFTAKGLEEARAKAPRELHSLAYPGCLPEAVVSMLGDVPVSSLLLSWDTPRKRALWSIQAERAKPKHVGAEACTLVTR